MVKMLFDDLKQFVFQWRASQPTSTYFSYHKFTRRISQVCISVSCIVVTRVSEGGGIKTKLQQWTGQLRRVQPEFGRQPVAGCGGIL